jgi:hypothetical protein
MGHYSTFSYLDVQQCMGIEEQAGKTQSIRTPPPTYPK